LSGPRCRQFRSLSTVLRSGRDHGRHLRRPAGKLLLFRHGPGHCPGPGRGSPPIVASPHPTSRLMGAATTMTRNLIISPVWDDPQDRSWFDGADSRDFDVWLIYYGQRPEWSCEQARRCIHRTGFKWEHIYFATDELADFLQLYDCIWCPDDDVALDAASINAM